MTLLKRAMQLFKSMKVGYGESREAGRTLAAIAKEVHLSGNPLNPPCALIAGGGTGTNVNDLAVCIVLPQV